MALILAIDEDVVLTMSLDLQLGHVGHAVRRVSTVAQAKAAFTEHTPAVIVIDPTVSEQGGWELIELWCPTVPTFVMSHDPTEATHVRASMLGCQSVLRKPILVRELIDALLPFLPAVKPLDAEHRTEVGVQNTPEAPRSSNPTAAERRAARERDAKAKPPAVEQRSEVPAVADPLGLASNDDDDLLLAGLPTTAYTEPTTHVKQESLGMQMRAQRIKRNIPLNQVDLAIGVHMAYLQAMEEDRFSHLPRGRMAEEMITKYAKYLNIDVSAALLTYRSFQYSEPVEPITDYGAANLVVVRYAGIIRTMLALIVLGGLCYGLWIYENQRIYALLNQASGLMRRPPVPTVLVDTPVATTNAAVALPPTSTPTPVPTTPVPAVTATLSPSETSLSTPASTQTQSMQPTTGQRTTPSASARRTATNIPALTATVTKNP